VKQLTEKSGEFTKKTMILQQKKLTGRYTPPQYRPEIETR